MGHLSTIIVIALLVLLAGNILALLQQTMSFFDTGIVQVISQNLWSVTRVGTRRISGWAS